MPFEEYVKLVYSIVSQPMPANVQPPVQQAQSAEPTSRTALQPVATPEKNVAGGYAVQVASFPLRSEAEQSKNKLLAKGYGAYIVESNLGAKGTWYRVQIGKKMEQGAAKELANKVGKGALVITDRP
jgi:cell division septation protein DedD